MGKRWGTRLLLGGAAVAAAVAVGRARHRSLLSAEEDECGPDPRVLPEGQSTTVTTDDGAELAVTVAGPEDGRTVVLSHCWMGGRSIWATTARLLTAEGYRVVMYDQRGHGESSLPEGALTLDRLALDLRAVIDQTQTTDAIAVGHSMGGMTIQAYAGLHPDHFASHVAGAVLVATSARALGRVLPVGLAERVVGDLSPRWTREGPIGRRVVRGSLGRVAHPSHIAVTAETLAATRGAARAGLLDAMAAMDLRGHLTAISVPTTVLIGTRDRLTPPASSRVLAASIPDAELVVLPHKGHMLPLEAPRAVVAAILDVERRSLGAVAGPSSLMG